MKFTVAIPLLIILIFPLTSISEGKGWRGISPLRSTRTEVEKLLGSGTNECKCSYYLEDMNVFFVYSSGDCERGGSGDWNIPPETVIRFTIYPKIKPKLSDLNINENKFKKQQTIGDALVYVNQEEGLSIEVQQGEVMSFNYGPTEADERLRCPGYNGIHFSSDIPKEMRARLLERLSLFVEYSSTGQYEKLYGLYLPEFAAKMFKAKNEQEFAKLVRYSGSVNESWIEFKPRSITTAEDKTYGKVYYIYGLVKSLQKGKTVESYRNTRAVIKGGEWYLIDFFRLMPL